MNSGDSIFLNALSSFLNTWRGELPVSGTSRPSIFFSTDRSTSCPNIGIERPGALMRSRTMILIACFTTRRSAPWLGGTRGPAQVLFERFAVDAGLPVNRQIVGFQKIAAPTILSQCACTFSSARFSSWCRCFTKLPDEKRNVRRIRNRRVIGSAIFSTRRAGVASIASAIRKLVE